MKDLLKVEGAKTPEDIFGTLIPGTQAAQIKYLQTIYRQFRSALHTDHNPGGDERRLNAAFDKVTRFHAEAEEFVKNGSYGKERVLMTITTKTTSYDINAPLTEITTGLPVEWSAAAQFFRATSNGQKVLLKISRDPSFNAMLKNEMKVLTGLTTNWPADSSDPQNVVNILNRFPKISDCFEAQINGVTRVVLVMKDPGTLVSLQEIIQSDDYRNTLIDKKHIAWMWRRTLETLMHFEECGYIFGGATPDHLLFNVESHEIRIMDLCHTVKLGEKITTMISKWKDYYPPEVLNKENTVPSTDTYMAALCMLRAQTPGTDTSTKIIESYFSAASIKTKHARTENALTLYTRYDDIIHNRLGWQKKFVVFPLKKKAT